jgi:hypothetical protein
MTPEIEELTTDLDRASGQRRIRLTDGDERLHLLMLHECNEALGDETPRFVPVEHPPVNNRLAEQLLDIVCALRVRRFCLSLSDA